MDDEDLLKRIADGADSAIDALIFKYHKPLYGYVYRMTGNEHTAADIVQETFVILYRQVLKQQIPDTLKPWLYKIATNLCRDYWKKAATRREIPWEREQENQQEDGLNFADRIADRQWLMDTIHHLHADHQSVIYLRFYQDFTYDQISETLDIPVNTVKSRLYRALKQLENRLESSWNQQTTGKIHSAKRGV